MDNNNFYIKSKIKQVDYETDRILEQTLRKVRNQVQRSFNYNDYFNNYQLYPPQVGQFYNNYPFSLPYYRPIKYFYQRPIHIEPNMNHQTILSNQRISEINSQPKKWAKPLRMEDLIKAADEVHYPVGQLLSEEEIKKKREEILELKKRVEEIDPAKRKEMRILNKPRWNKIRKFIHIRKFWSIMKEYSMYCKYVNEHRNFIAQASKADFAELTKFMADKLKGIEDFAIDYFTQLFTLDKSLKNKYEDTVFIIKNFVHQIFYELSTNTLKGDVPEYVYKIMMNYIQDNVYLPNNSLTTFEFNRLEFGLNLKTKGMNSDRQAMQVCFILLYRIMILEIFTNYTNYFKRLSNLKSKSYKNNLMEDKIVSKNNITQDNIRFNLNFIIYLLHLILKDAFLTTPKVYREYFKDTFLFKKYAIDGFHFEKAKDIADKLKKDSIEIAEKIKEVPRVIEFAKEHFRWVSMYKMTAYTFCVKFAENINN